MPNPLQIFRRAMVGCAALTAFPLAYAPLVHAQDDRQTVVGDDVAIYNLAGRIRVERGSGRDVSVEVTRGGRDGRRLSFANSDVRGRRSFRVVYPAGDNILYRPDDRADARRYNSSMDMRVNDDGTWGDDRSGYARGRRIRVSTGGSGTEAWADLVVRVPVGKTVTIYSGIGELSATRIDATLRLDASASRVVASDIRGALDIDAGSGGVDVSDIDVSTLRVDVGSGGIALRDVLSERCTFDTGSGGVRGESVRCGQISVDVGSGSVRLNSLRSSDVRVDAGSGGVTLDFSSSPRLLQVDAGSGTVTVGLPSSIGATLDIETGSGGISTDFPVTTNRMERNTLRGTIGDGSARIRIESGSGGVRLRKAVN